MATPGVPFDIPIATIVASIKKHKGRLGKVAQELKCHFCTIKKYTDKHPEVVELIKDLRRDWNETLLDAAEDTLTDAMDARIDDMGSALKSAFFVLNNKGRERGYIPPSQQESSERKYSFSEMKQFAEQFNPSTHEH